MSTSPRKPLTPLEEERQKDRRLFKRMRKTVEALRWTFATPAELQPVFHPLGDVFDACDAVLDLVGPARSNGRRLPPPVLDRDVIEEQLAKLRGALVKIGKEDGGVESGPLRNVFAYLATLDRWAAALEPVAAAVTVPAGGRP
jgi:hypothetical protein